MNFNLTKIMFTLMLIFSTILTMSSSNWLMMWMSLELNLFSIIPILNFNSNNYSIESTMKYFLIQALASIILLMLILNKSLFFIMNYNMMIMLPLLMKLSLMPFHLWLPSMIEGLNWFACFLMLTWQKIAPMILISYLYLNKTLLMLVLLILLNSIFGMNQNSLRKILAMSSINNSSWMMIMMILNEMIWMNYFLIYSIINLLMINIFYKYNINYINQIKFFNLSFFNKLNLLMLILSLMGLPPMIGFFMKWMLIKMLIYNKFYLILIMLTLLTIFNLFFYIKMSYFLLFNFNLFNKWFFQNKKKNKFNYLLIMNFFSMFFMYILFF